MFEGSSLEKSLNRDTRGISATVRYRRTPLTTIVMRTEKAQERFASSPARDADILRIEPGVEFRPPALISGSGHLGFRRLAPLHDVLPEFHGLVGSGRLRFRLPGATSVEFAGDRDLSIRTKSFNPTHSQRLRRDRAAPDRARFDASVSGQRQRYSYRDLIVPGSATTLRGSSREDTTVSTPCRLVTHSIATAAWAWGIEDEPEFERVTSTRFMRASVCGTTVTYGF